MDEIAGKAAAAPLLTGGVSATPGSRITAPCGIVPYPSEIDFDETYKRGHDKITGEITIWIGRPDEPQSRDFLTAFCDGDGANSIKALLESTPTNTYTRCDTVSVSKASMDAYDHGGVTYLVAVFELDIYGPGEG